MGMLFTVKSRNFKGAIKYEGLSKYLLN